MVGLDPTFAAASLASARTAAQDAQKLEAVGRLAGGIAHDLNNLMTAISGYAELALSDVEQDDPIRFDLVEISSAADRATSLTRQLLAIRDAMLDPGITFVPEPVDASESTTRVEER